MTTRSEPAKRMPRDVRARERLRDAQAAEARALSAVCAAQTVLARAVAKQEQAISAASAQVTRAHQALAVRQAALAKISGLDRAASLLGLDRRQLREAVKTADVPSTDPA